jgi:xanthine/uracil/vitamin C permease (AzgA family)
MSVPSTSTKPPASRAASLFDLRWIIALLFGVYGIVVTAMGIWFTSQAELDKAGGINANLWTGIPMLVVAILFAVWAQLRPVQVPAQATEEPHEDATESP